jgi:uncharacterized SAM-binding protein YcdF (DUF218 family)
MKMSAVVRIVFLILSAAGAAWFMEPIRHNVLDIGSGSGLSVCVLAFLAALIYPMLRGAAERSKKLRNLGRVAAVLISLGLVWSAGMTSLMASAAADPPETATVVVLGSKVSGSVPSADLWARINAAAAYLKAHPKAVCVACGAKGNGEAVSEASAIHDGLTVQGIDSARIFLEDGSYSTQQNFENALKIIRARSLSTELAVVTDDYHEYRACSIARGMGASPYAVSAQTPEYIFSACWAREVLALTRYLLLR